MSKIYNLENQYFGDLHVLYKAPKDTNKKKNYTQWVVNENAGI